MTPKQERAYNAAGILRLASGAADLVSMMAAGSTGEISDAANKLYNGARQDFPKGPLEVRDALNAACSELDLPLIFGAHEKDSGRIR